jgi:hypothetical protein
MTGVQLGGIDPSILRELSGVYKPFVKALKELVSNAFDADADHVHITIADDFSSLKITDDGEGMTPFEFRNDFTRIGGGSRRWLGERTSKGRLRIGSKGIGFLALARYCSCLKVESTGTRKFHKVLDIPETPAIVALDEIFGFAIPELLLARRLRCEVSQVSGRIGDLVRGKHFKIDTAKRQLKIVRPVGAVKLQLSFDCKNLAFRATLDFERLLELADKADLDKLAAFASIDIWQCRPSESFQGTRITAHNLKHFVRRELRTERRKGNVRNIASRDGLERLVWYLSRCTPVQYATADRTDVRRLQEHLSIPDHSVLQELRVSHGSTSRVLERSIYPFEQEALPLHDDMLIEVKLDEGGLKATGFIAGYENVIFPAEYRGITIRVRGVAIGDPHFFGAEYLLTGASKAALSQITGEINVFQGLDAVDALNPGRESFYEESEQYKILRQRLIGEGEHVTGYLGQAIAAVLRRSQVRSALKDVLGRAMLRRRALDDISAAVADIIASGEKMGIAIRNLLKSQNSHTNGLAHCSDLPLSVSPRVGGLKVVPTQYLAEPAEIDYHKGEIRLDMTRPEWDWTLVLFDRRVQVVNKRGGVHRPLGELDLRNECLLINWEHPIRAQMDERSFLRMALSWILAKEAASGDAEQMMELALRLLSFKTDTVDA